MKIQIKILTKFGCGVNFFYEKEFDMSNVYANISGVIRINRGETMVVYCKYCNYVVLLFNNKNTAAGLSSRTIPISTKKDIIRKCAEMGLPEKVIFTKIDGWYEVFFKATCVESDEIVVMPVREMGEVLLAVGLAKHQEMEMIR